MDSPRGRIVLMQRRPRGLRAQRPDGRALRQLPGLHGVRHRLPVGRALRPAHQRHARADRAPPPALAGEARCCAARSSRCSRTPAACARRSRCRAGRSGLAAGAAPRLRDPRPPFAARSARAAGDAARRGAPAARAPRRARRARGRVGFLQGCVQRVYFGDVNAATVARARRRGLRGPRARRSRAAAARSMGHAGEEDGARALARETIERFEALRDRRRQRRGLRLGDEGVRPPAARRPGVGRARRGVLRARAATSPSCSPASTPRAVAPPARR